MGFSRSAGSIAAPGPSQECGRANAGPFAPSAIVHSLMASDQERMPVSLICSSHSRLSVGDRPPRAGLPTSVACRPGQIERQAISVLDRWISA